jgi:glycosyltransferase involved in cell wall biosynthesis
VPGRVAVVTNVLPTYRRAFYDALCAAGEFSVTVFCQERLPGFNLAPAHEQIGCPVRLLRFAGSERALVWQRLPVRELWSGFDAYVFYGNIRVLSNLLWASLFHAAGRPVLLWGQAHTAGANPRLERVRLAWWRSFDHLLVYTDAEVDYLRARGFAQDVTGLNNGLDQRAVERAAAAWPPERLAVWQAAQGLDGRVPILSVARLAPKNRFDTVVRALPALVEHFPGLLWCVVGGGEEEASLRALAASLGVGDAIRWVGPEYAEERLAPWFLSSRAFVLPGSIGLSLLHAFGYGLPVVTHANPANQMPEFAALAHGVNGLAFPEGDLAALTDCIALLLSQPAAAQQMGRNGLEVARTRYNVDVMVERFSAALRRALAAG